MTMNDEILARYAFTPAVRSGETVLELTADALRVTARGKIRVIALGDVTRVRLFAASGAAVCAVRARDGGARIVGASALGLGRAEDRSHAFVDFVRALHERLAVHAPNARYAVGSPITAALGWAAIALAAAALAIGAALVIAAEPGATERVGAASLLKGALSVGVLVVLGVPMALAGRGKPYAPGAPPLPKRA